MATSFAAAVAIGYFAGSYLDSKFGTAPYLMLILLLLGVATGLKIMYDQAFRNGANHKDKVEGEEGGRKYAPSKEIITALDEAKKMVAELDRSDTKPRD
jgi:hypothetical protein